MPRRTRIDRSGSRRTAASARPDRRRGARKRPRHEDAVQAAPAEQMYTVYDGVPDMDSPCGGRVLGIDYGASRTGLAVSDPAARIAQGLDTLETTDQEDILAAVDRLVARYGVKRIVIGMPVNMDGTNGEMAGRVRAFARALAERTGLQPVFWDERLTSSAAQRALHEMGQRLKGRKKTLDRISATLILQGYLDHIRRDGAVSD